MVVSTASWAPFHKGTVIKARDRHIDTDKGVRGHSSPTRAAARSSDSGVHQTGSTLHGGRQEGQEGDDTDRCGRTGAGGGAAGGEGELRAGRNSSGERATAEWASLGKQKGPRGHIQLSQELCLEMRSDCGRSWPRALGSGKWSPGSLDWGLRGSISGEASAETSGKHLQGSLPKKPPGKHLRGSLRGDLRKAEASGRPLAKHLRGSLRGDLRGSMSGDASPGKPSGSISRKASGRPLGTHLRSRPPGKHLRGSLRGDLHESLFGEASGKKILRGSLQEISGEASPGSLRTDLEDLQGSSGET